MGIGTTLWAVLVLAQAASQTEETELVQRWRQACQQQADLYTIGSLDPKPLRFSRWKTPIFSHATPARGNDIGSVFLWVDGQERPMMVADIFAWSLNNNPQRQIVHECHSLAPVPLEVRIGDRQPWKPERPGVTWTLLPDGPPPAAMKAQRWRQARDLAQQFSANSIDNQGGRWELRVLPQSVYQYDVQTQVLRQTGAMFAVCQGTDPELWILLEARADRDGDRWHFACASFTDYALKVRWKEQELWSCPKYVQGTRDAEHFIEGLFSNVTPPELAK